MYQKKMEKTLAKLFNMPYNYLVIKKMTNTIVWTDGSINKNSS